MRKVEESENQIRVIGFWSRTGKPGMRSWKPTRRLASSTSSSRKPEPNNRALGVDVDDGIMWLWIGTHGQYDNLIG